MTCINQETLLFPCKQIVLQLLKIDGLALAQSSGQSDATVFGLLQARLISRRLISHFAVSLSVSRCS